MSVEPQVIAYLARIATALERLAVASETLFEEVEVEAVELQRKLAAGVPEGIQWS